jgi:hypothetical protein
MTSVTAHIEDTACLRGNVGQNALAGWVAQSLESGIPISGDIGGADSLHGRLLSAPEVSGGQHPTLRFCRFAVTGITRDETVAHELAETKVTCSSSSGAMQYNL